MRTQLDWQYVSQLRDEGLTFRQIAQLVNVNPNTLRRLARRFLGAKRGKKAHISEGGTADRREVLEAYLQSFFDPSWALPAKRASIARTVVVLADLHGAPSAEVLAAAISERPHLIVLAGDLLDGQAASPHVRLPHEQTKRIKLQEEIRTVRAFIETLLIHTNAEILVMRGNHDDWAARKAAELLPSELLDFWRDPIDVLLAGLPEERVQEVRQVWEYHYPNGLNTPLGESRYMLLLDDVLISHANFTGKYAGEAVRKLYGWLNDWHYTLNLPRLRLLIQAHVHKMCLIENDQQVWVEPGAAFEPHVEGYKVGYQPRWRPGQVGCVVFEQYQTGSSWQTDLSSVFLIRPNRSSEGLPA